MSTSCSSGNPLAGDDGRVNLGEASLDESSGHSRRRFLLAATSTVGGLYVAAAALPFLDSMTPTLRADTGSAELGSDWPGGFFCPCHGSKFDLAGRVFRDVPAPSNLEIPSHRYLDEARLVIGEEERPQA